MKVNLLRRIRKHWKIYEKMVNSQAFNESSLERVLWSQTLYTTLRDGKLQNVVCGDLHETKRMILRKEATRVYSIKKLDRIIEMKRTKNAKQVYP